MYSEMKKNIENSEPAISTAMMYDAVRVRELGRLRVAGKQEGVEAYDVLSGA